MPPLSYIVTAILLAALVAISIPMTLGFSVILWYWGFAAAACLLVIVGGFRVVGGLHAPPWIGVVLALPSCVWAADALFKLTSSLNVYSAVIFAAAMALAAAAFGALRLIELMSTPHAAFRVGYGILAARVLEVAVAWSAYATGSTFTNNAVYDALAWAVGIAAMLIEYGAFIGAAVLIMVRRDVERWTGAAISLIIAYLFYQAMRPYEYPDDGLMFWSQPVIMFIGAAAVWRIGSVLRARASGLNLRVALDGEAP